MLTLLRKIRRSLMASGSTRRYFLYAIGEIALVVIGILIALQINNWNTFQQERQKEKKALENLSRSIELNINRIASTLSGIDRNNVSGRIILHVIENQLPFSDSLGNHIHRALLNNSNLVISNSGYESLRSTGFDIIQNEALKNEIINLYEDTYLRLYRQQEWGRTVRPDFDNYLMDRFIRKARGLTPMDFDKVSRDHYFYGLVNTAEAQRGFYKRHYTTALEETRRVLQLLKDELNGVK